MRNKIAMMIALAVVLVVALVGSGPALAQQVWGVIQCDSDPATPPEPTKWSSSRSETG